MTDNKWWRGITIDDIPVGSRWRHLRHGKEFTIVGVREERKNTRHVVVDGQYPLGSRTPYEIDHFRHTFERVSPEPPSLPTGDSDT